MTDIWVKDLVKSFEIGDNILDGLSFEVLEGERVGIMGRNGAGKTTLFKILTGQMDYDSGEVMIAPGKKLGLISQIPHYPAGYTAEERDLDCFLFGHTHQPFHDRRGKCTFLNPGSIGAFHGASFAVLDIGDGRLSARLYRLGDPIE